MLPVHAQEAGQRADNSRRAALEAPRRTDARQLPHEPLQVEAADVDEEPLQDVGMTAQMCPPQVPRLKQMDERTFESFPALAEQAPPAGAPNASAVGIDRGLRGSLARPVPAPSVGFGDIGAHADVGKLAQRPVAVVPLVGHHLPQDVGVRADRLKVLGRRGERLD